MADWESPICRALREAAASLEEGQATGSYSGGEEKTARRRGHARRRSALASSLGECRRARPYSTLRPVIDLEGSFIWSCNHEEEHCVAVS